MSTTFRLRMLQRRDTEANWTSVNPVLGPGEFGFIIGGAHDGQCKLGDGNTAWNDLAVWSGGASGHRVVPATGDVWAKAGDVVLTDTTLASLTVTLPAGAAHGDTVVVVDAFGKWGAHLTNILPSGTDTIDGLSSLGGNVAGAVVELIYNANSMDWRLSIGGN